MLPVQKIAALGALIGLFLAGSVAAADNPAPADTPAQKALAKDAVCTTCHNESWRVPVLSLYQTRHGNRADPRAPNCQSCHGASTGHQKRKPIAMRSACSMLSVHACRSAKS